MTSLREASTNSWRANAPASIEQINAGSLQRIADATEVMARRHNELLAEVGMYKRLMERERERRQHAERRIAALKGVVTKLKASAEGSDD